TELFDHDSKIALNVQLYDKANTMTMMLPAAKYYPLTKTL
ncbi:MAG: hypothetical protein ACJAYF_002482, partial [Arenicella sp.]